MNEQRDQSQPELAAEGAAAPPPPRRGRRLLPLAFILTAITVASGTYHIIETGRGPEVKAQLLRTAADLTVAGKGAIGQARVALASVLADEPAPAPAPAPVPQPASVSPPAAPAVVAASPPVAPQPVPDVAAAVSEAMAGHLAALPDRAELTRAVESARAGAEAAVKVAVAAATQPLEARIAAYEAELAGLRRQQARTASLLAIIHLKAAIDQGASYPLEWKTARALAQDDEAMAAALDRLKPGDDKGVLTVAMLQRRFRSIKSTLEKSEQAASKGWLDATLNRFQSLMPFSLTEESPGAVVTTVARAEEHLARGRVAEATDELASLPLPALDLASAWIEEARKRIETDRTLSELTALALRAAQPAR